MEKESSNPKKNFGKTLFVTALGIVSVIYIFNPTAGILELIPDNIPLIGNLDEATAIAILIASMRYFGFDITNFLSGKKIDIIDVNNENTINLDKEDK